jgi:nitrite reductase/ring-hydroxylating ferredoxin subunit
VCEWTSLGPAENRPELGSVRIGALELAVARLGDGSFAVFDDTCTHEECPLSEGELEGERVICYCHSSEFDVRSGAVLRGPATEPLRIYAARTVAAELEVCL